MRELIRDAALLLGLALIIGAGANQLRPHRLAWWGEGQQPPMADVDYRLLDVGSVDALRTSLPKVVIVDTRQPDAVAAGRVPGAWHLDYTELAAQLTPERLLALKQADAVVLYGLADEGDIEQLLAQELHRRGLQPPYVMVGGFPAWQAAGLEVEATP